MASTWLASAILLLFPAGMAMAASMDLLTMTIPNRLCLALAVAFFPAALLFHMPLPEIGFNATCGFGVLCITFALFSLGWIGGGDAKLAAATALWLGWGAMLDYGLSSAMFGGALTLLLLGARRLALPAWARSPWVMRLHDPKTGVPYGIALAAAGLMVYGQTPFWRAVASI